MMRSMFALGAGLFGCVLALDALACRCAQRPLADYFANADEVVFARLVADFSDNDERHLTLALMTAPYKTTASRAGLASGDRVTYVTGASSASCGLPALRDAVYILFAQSDPGQPGRLLVNTCNGSRVHLAGDGMEAQGFEDVPARFVVRQLAALSAMEVLRAVAHNAPKPGDENNRSLIGLLDIKSLAHGAMVPVHAAPDGQAQVIGQVEDYSALESKESGYEVSSAVVLARRDGWYRVRLADGTPGWIAPEHGGTYFPYAELPVRRLAYLNEHWSGFVWPDPGAGIPTRSGLKGSQRQRSQYAAEVHESQMVGGLVWFRVSVLVSSPCDGGEAKATLTGWVPGYGASGEPAVWFHSRGC